MRTKCFLIAGILILVLFTLSCKPTGEFDSLAECLSQKGFRLYGAEKCSHCQSQKKMFGESFRYIEYIDCSAESGFCIESGIRAYPTWEFPNGTRHKGRLSLGELAVVSGCGAG